MEHVQKAGQPKTGEAGRGGVGVRSDLHVRIEGRDRGGIDLSLASKVAPYYGEQLAQQVRLVLQQLGVEHAVVQIDDYGGLPLVVQARIEAAVRAAGLGQARGDARPEPWGPLPPPSKRDRLRRSRLYLPGNEPKFMVNAALHEPDGIILDLEDSVHPSAKGAARLLVRNALRSIDFRAAERMVRINQLDFGLEDLTAVVPEGPDVILLPKTETPEQVRKVDQAITQIQQDGRTNRPIWLMPILESALGVENAFAIASASSRVVALTIGLEDYTADLAVVKTVEGHESGWARSRLVNAARAAGVQAIDSVFGDVGNEAGLRSWAERSRAMGFEGMGCVHPRQISVIHRAFAPTDVELGKARKIVDAFAQAQARGLGVVSLGSKMIDPPVVERARKLVAQAEAMGLLEPGNRV